MKKNDIEALKQAHPIAETIGRYIELKRQGRGHIGICPFHDDHHPSLYVDDARQTFVCYSCGERGDVIDFVRKMEGCTFAEALGKMCKGEKSFAHAIHADSCGSGPNKSGVGERFKSCVGERFFAPTDASHEKFLHQLLPYASGHSDLTPTYLDFEVGQSPALVSKEWRQMANRIIFPIRDEAGRLVAFGARRLSDADKSVPKYVNSPTSDLYKKGETLYGLYQAKRAIEEEDAVFIVEGYKDVLAMHAAGWKNTVALCGTALTDGHVRLLKRHTDRVYLLLDGDEAGQAAAMKIRERLAGEGQEVENIRLPEGEDPDSCFRTLGAERFREMVRSLIDKPHPSEYALVWACLSYPSTLCTLGSIRFRFIDQVAHMLLTERLPFEGKEHREILQCLLNGEAEEHFPEELWQVSRSIRAEYQESQERRMANGCGKREGKPVDENRLDTYLCRLIYLYMESRILRELQQLGRRLKRVRLKKERTDLLVRITDRRELLRHVSLRLDRPGVVVSG